MSSLQIQTPAANTVAFRTVGCRLNQSDTAQMQEALHIAGFRVVRWEERADVRVVNTCTVTAKSDRTCRHAIHSAKRLDPECLLAVTGCYAQVSPGEAAAIPGVDLVVGNPEQHRLAEYLAASLGYRSGQATLVPGAATAAAAVACDAATAAAATGDSAAATAWGTSPAVAARADAAGPDFFGDSCLPFHGRTRAFLKVQTGCDSACAYCIVPLARGPARSMPKAAVLEQVRRLESHGYREVVLTGIDLGSWGRVREEGRLADLLKSLMGGDNPDGEEANDLPQHRYRLSSIEPLEVDDALIEVVESSGDLVARHFHLPLQSGADSVLARMGRPYSGAQYLDVVRRLAGRLPGSALGADVIVGFPGETEREFDQTLSLVEASPLTYLHVFGYSDRPGTRAAAMGPKVPPEVIKVRSERLRSLGARKKAAFRATVAGSAQVALVLDERASDGRMVGLTGNYVKVLVEGATTLVNRFVRVRLERSLEDGRWESTLIETHR